MLVAIVGVFVVFVVCGWVSRRSVRWIRRMDTTPEDMRRADDGRRGVSLQFGLYVDPPKR